jgi:2-methylisocitrate lyase-like PEP mutase family enzyme
MTQPTRKLSSRATWKHVLAEHAPLLLPVAHDALTARLIQFAGYPAYQAGGFDLMGTRVARPGIDRTHYWEHRALAWDAIAASDLPVLVDLHDHGHDPTTVAQSVRGYEVIGASALALDDRAVSAAGGRASPGQVLPAGTMESMIRAAAAARRNPETFLLARTSADDPRRLDEALRRAERYLSAGADGVHVDAVHRPEELERTGRALRGAPLAATVLADGAAMPWIAPAELHRLGFSMILYPTTVIFGVTRAIRRTLKGLRHVGHCARDAAPHAVTANR